MEQIEALNAIASIASSISTVGVLIWWVLLERKRTDTLIALITSDWQRQREEEIERRAEEKFSKKMTTIGGGL